MSRLVSVDLETTGLDPSRHEAWEVALVMEDGQSACWQFSLLRAHDADPGALQVGDFYNRYSWPRPGRAHLRDEPGSYEGLNSARPSARDACKRIAELTAGKTLMGLNVGSFDAVFLTKLLRGYNIAPAWSHRYLELGSYAAAVLDRTHPVSGQAIAEYVANDNAHDALADATWNWEAYRYLKQYLKMSLA